MPFKNKIIKDTQFHHSMISKVLVWCLALLFLILFWNLKLEGISRPTAHIPAAIDGKIRITVGALREIVVQGESSDEPLNITIRISSEENQVVYEETFEGITLTGDRDTIAQFAKEEPLSLTPGNYYVEVSTEEKQIPLHTLFIEYNGDYKNSYIGLSVIILMILAAVLVMCERSAWKLETAYIVVTIFLGVLLSYVMPPLCAGDEYAHFLESYQLSSKILHTQDKDNNGYVLLRADDYDSAVYLHDAASISDWFETFERGNVTDMVSAGEKSTVASKSWYVYLPSALMLALVRICGGSGHILLLLGRLTNLLIVTVLIALSIKLIPRGKVFVACLGLLPETIYLANSFSYDGINLGLCILLASYFYYMYDRSEHITWKQLIVYVVLCALMIPVKTVYIWYAFLLLLLPMKKIALSKKVIALLLAGAGVVVVVIAIKLWPSISSLSTSGLAPSTGELDGVSISYIMNNPKDFITVLGNSLFPELAGFKYPERYLATSFGQVLAADRYAGRDLYTMPAWMCAAVLITAMIGLEDTKENPISARKRIVIACLGCGMVFGVFMAMYFASTLTASRKIYGISGRYFLPVYALLPLIVKNRWFEVKFDVKKVCMAVMVLINLFYWFDVFWHYSYVYFAQPVV